MKDQADCYDYVRRYYGVPAYIGVRVRYKDREGVLVKSRGDQYVYIRFDGDKRVTGPCHPTDGIIYLPVGSAPDPSSPSSREPGAGS